MLLTLIHIIGHSFGPVLFMGAGAWLVVEALLLRARLHDHLLHSAHPAPRTACKGAL